MAHFKFYPRKLCLFEKKKWDNQRETRVGDNKAPKRWRKAKSGPEKLPVFWSQAILIPGYNSVFCGLSEYSDQSRYPKLNFTLIKIQRQKNKPPKLNMLKFFCVSQRSQTQLILLGLLLICAKHNAEQFLYSTFTTLFNVCKSPVT